MSLSIDTAAPARSSAGESRPGDSSDPAAIRLVDVHALHKSGTMFLFHFFSHLARIKSLRLLSPNHDPPDPVEHFELLSAPRGEHRATPIVIRAPLRSFDLDNFAVTVPADQYRIFHVRDPRDMLVSEYFSFGWIHPTATHGLSDRRDEIQQMTVDEYVIRQSEESTLPLEQKFAPLIDHAFDPQRETVVKYEDMVTRFPRWCYRVLRALDMPNTPWLTTRLAWRYRREFQSRGESMEHKRRIIPGDFRDKLKPRTIERLNERFAPILRRFDYLP